MLKVKVFELPGKTDSPGARLTLEIPQVDPVCEPREYPAEAVQVVDPVFFIVTLTEAVVPAGIDEGTLWVTKDAFGKPKARACLGASPVPSRLIAHRARVVLIRRRE
jgi:hypothetical protein